MPMILGSFHTPVLLNEVLDALNVSPGKIYIDATIGGGGHSLGIVKRGGRVLGIDQDQEAIQFVTREKDRGYPYDKLVICEGNFKDIGKLAGEFGFKKVDGILFDLGVSSFQIDNSGRGFSFHKDENLDMRMSKRGEKSAKDIINHYSRERLYEIFAQNAEELNSRPIADAIFRTRTVKKGEIGTTKELAEIIESVLKKIHPNADRRNFDHIKTATLARIFQAIRIEVNDELAAIKDALRQSVDLLNPEGRIAVISFHSLEDRIVKLFFEEKKKENTLRIVTKRPLQATYDETKENKRAHSAKLRVAEKI